ncbi:hypothetical protein MKW94_016962 [Papaver nudicaule]|uniref:ADP-ribosylation factor-like protein 8A n=1 Tax=Papaver nudicaule TaxID=74823 RepID=A0AA41RLR1_PAPNU|nr:hypothetical protein [Papaver nudicaule]
MSYKLLHLINWYFVLFFKQEMELSLIGLQNAGKTSLVNVVATGGYSEDMIPTIGFNMRKVTKGNVTIKLWDLGGQPRFRSMWERYCRAVSAIRCIPLIWIYFTFSPSINNLFEELYANCSNQRKGRTCCLLIVLLSRYLLVGKGSYSVDNVI